MRGLILGIKKLSAAEALEQNGTLVGTKWELSGIVVTIIKESEKQVTFSTEKGIVTEAFKSRFFVDAFPVCNENGLKKTKRPNFNSSGSKYLRSIVGSVDGKIDVYAVLVSFDVKCPARQHAIKKLLCSGIRGKASVRQDLEEARDAILRAIQLLGSEKS